MDPSGAEPQPANVPSTSETLALTKTKYVEQNPRKSERKSQDARTKTYQNHPKPTEMVIFGHGESGEIMRNPPPDGISINNGLATSRQLPATSSHASHGQESQLRHTNRELHLRFDHGRQVQVGSQTSREKHRSHAKITGM